ncbi:hypothetical protein AeNC1_018748 [Aphanomyces euteiches]|nr:hypothetical protein AeNC1_018748 [Aphanomyces euteiches]
MVVGQGHRSVAFKDLDTAKFGAAHIRAMLVAGSGFFVDSYDNFVIGLIVPMIAWENYGKSGLPSSQADGVGIGGDYPVSAVITSEFASSDRRGQFIAAVFAMQGFGIIVAATLAIIMLAAMQTHIVNDTVNIGYVWRFLAGFGAVPALAAVYWRLRILETPRFTVDVLGDQEAAIRNANQFLQGTAHDNNISVPKPNTTKSFSEAFRTHFSQWANVKC